MKQLENLQNQGNEKQKVAGIPTVADAAAVMPSAGNLGGAVLTAKPSMVVEGTGTRSGGTHSPASLPSGEPTYALFRMEQAHLNYLVELSSAKMEKFKDHGVNDVSFQAITCKVTALVLTLIERGDEMKSRLLAAETRIEKLEEMLKLRDKAGENNEVEDNNDKNTGEENEDELNEDKKVNAFIGF